MYSGLFSKSEIIPLIDVTVSGKIIDSFAEITICKKYCNLNNNEEETFFKFPMDLFGALIDFQVTIGGKQYETQLKTREKEIHKLEGQNAEENPDTFICYIGKLEAQSQIQFQLTFVIELQVEDGKFCLILPSSILFLPLLNEKEEAINSQLHIQPSLSLLLNLSMSSNIEKIQSLTHNISVFQFEGFRGIVKYEHASDKSPNLSNFVLLIQTHSSYSSWSLLEQDKKTSNKAIALSFFPTIPSESLSPLSQTNELLFLIDCSNSMDQLLLKKVKDTFVELFTSQIPKNSVLFNLIRFGSTFEKLFPTQSQILNDETLPLVGQFLQHLETSKLGETLLLPLLESIYSLPPNQNISRQIVLITDGYISSPTSILNLVKKNLLTARIFTIGTGDFVSFSLVYLRILNSISIFFFLQLD